MSIYHDRARELLREQLSRHPDEGVRLLNEIAEPGDDNPAVAKLAAILRDRADKRRSGQL